jgi:excinuclease ABC subunit A
MVCVTGVSGSGKSTLINDLLLPNLRNHIARRPIRRQYCDDIEGLEQVDRVLEVDQRPIGRTPRSNPATYTKVFDLIRALFAAIPEARMYGYSASRFSFNVSGAKQGGRCETCSGAGVRTIEMKFLSNTYVPCEDCAGRRFNEATLRVRYLGRSIADVLDLTVDQAVELFSHMTGLARKFKTLQEVGLGYITLGQSATTLSGGEAQRVKLAAELARIPRGHTVYILDEPTTGLHLADIEQLLKVLFRLRDMGNTVIVIEHNLDVIKMADHIIDLGPDGGDGGGRLIGAGTPEEISRIKNSETGKYLKPYLK